MSWASALTFMDMVAAAFLNNDNPRQSHQYKHYILVGSMIVAESYQGWMGEEEQFPLPDSLCHAEV